MNSLTPAASAPILFIAFVVAQSSPASHIATNRSRDEQVSSTYGHPVARGNHTEVEDCTKHHGRCQANGTDRAIRRPHFQADHPGETETLGMEHYEDYEYPNVTWRRLTELVVMLWNIVNKLI
ncbi:hypothetical protein P879_10078 [Paragonimus westermani]|uniref:Uncharacterized protein n=1 Tax=Paragonimus westermani TaxID=34504 RepID=A0A8T0DIW3_9TREM|nr:hypothetical protein P879_02817 [Paragonimus westermani]KAF8566908.1 hypothetical protein P879_10078 [Paragonimus westermani]